ncbi:MAG: ATP-binding cassette domain-containing protein [Rubrivivax sp.]|nr:ATP-binding cassette domain-containing protein [Rubrivivax sp.]
MRFGGVQAVAEVTLRLRRGELVCLIGPNGAGKTTFFRCLTGQHKPTGGRVWIAGQRVDGRPIHAITRLGVGIKTQVPSLAGALSVRENLWLGARRVAGRAEAQARVDALLAELGLQAVAERPAGQLAHGVRQMVEIGVAISTEPWLLLLDEPAGGLTQDEADRVADLVRVLNQRMTVIVVEHDMAFVRRIAQRVVVFHQGRVLADGEPGAVLADARVREVYLGSKVA